MLHRLSALTVTTLLSGALLVSVPATAAGETCHGRPATIVGTGPDIQGTPGDDVIVTGASRVTYASAGDDLICVSPSAHEDVKVYAGDGDDVVDASDPTPTSATLTHADLGTGLDHYLGRPTTYDHVRADGANDNVAGADLAILEVTDPATGPQGTYTAPDEVSGDVAKYGSKYGSYVRVLSANQGVEIDLAGHVVVAGVRVADIAGFSSASVVAPHAVVRGNAEDNHLAASGCHVTIAGKGGDDAIEGSAGEDAPKFECVSEATMRGGKGDDYVKGGLGRNRLIGNAGNDELQGRPRTDVLLGGSGHDDLSGGKGADVLRGNRGRDKADGHQGRDVCVAERERRCER